MGKTNHLDMKIFEGDEPFKITGNEGINNNFQKLDDIIGNMKRLKADKGVRKPNTNEGVRSTVFGSNNEASGENSFTSGVNCVASGRQGISVGESNNASGTDSYAEGKNTNATALCSHSEGMETRASNTSAHAEGYGATASGDASHAEGNRTIANGDATHVGGYGSRAVEHCSFVHGIGVMTGTLTIAEDTINLNRADYIVKFISQDDDGEIILQVENYNSWYYRTGDVVIVNKDHVEQKFSGVFTKGVGSLKDAIKLFRVPSMEYFGIEDLIVVKRGVSVLSETPTESLGTSSRTAIGMYNKGFRENDTFIIGKGTSESNRSNAFRVTNKGEVFGKSSFNSTGADYAEYFEWEDSNQDNEDRVGLFVTLCENKIKKASDGDFILGVVSGLPSIIGNADEDWSGRYQKDDFGRFCVGTFTKKVVEEVLHETIDEFGNENVSKELVEKEIEYVDFLVNPNYDDSKIYIPRSKRKEWSAVGMLGILSVKDDGTCQVNKYCKCDLNGTATGVEVQDVDTFRVIQRISDHVIQIVLK